jgi:hypothetical protein
MSTPSPSGLHPAGRSHVHNCYTYQRDLGVPFISFNVLTGHRSCTPEDYGRYAATLPQGPAPVTGVFPAGEPLRLLETGIQAIQLSPYHAGPPAHRPVRLGTAAGFLACYGPLHLTDPGKPSDPQTPPPVRARYTGDIAVRLVAHPHQATFARSTIRRSRSS